MTARRLWIFCAVAAAVLLASCAQNLPETQPTQPDVTTVPAAAPTTAPATEPPTEAPTEPPMPEWMRVPEYLSYEELFSEDREYENIMQAPYGYPSPCSWIVMDGDTGIEYTLMQGAEGVDDEVFYLCNTAENTKEAVLTIEEDGLRTLLGCDGRYAYVMDMVRLDTSLLKLRQYDLLTGACEIVAEAQHFLSAYICADTVLYYAAYSDTEKQIEICRVYLPEMKKEVLVAPDIPPCMFGLDEPMSTLGDIVWLGISPEMQQLVEKELADPASSYRAKHEFLWTTRDPMWNMTTAFDIRELCSDINQETEIGIGDGFHYCFADGSVFVSDPYGENPELALPTGIGSDWKPLPGADIQGTPTGGRPHRLALPRIDGEGFIPGKLYLVSEGIVTKLSDETVIQVRDYEDAVYFVTEDNRLLQVSYDGSICNTLYDNSSESLEILGYAEEFFYIIEKNMALQLDISNARYRTLFSFDESTGIVTWDWDAEENVFRLVVSRSGSMMEILYDLNTDTCTEKLH